LPKQNRLFCRAKISYFAVPQQVILPGRNSLFYIPASATQAQTAASPRAHAKHTKLTVEEFYHERAPLVLPQTSQTCSQKTLAFHTKNTKISRILRSILNNPIVRVG